MTKVTIRAKELQHVRQVAKDQQEKNVTISVSKGSVTFAIGQKASVVIQGRENGNSK